MAYNELDTGFDSGFEADPEERKRRLAAMAGLIKGQGLGDVAGQVVTNRFNQAEERLGNFTQQFESPEETMRKRLGVQEAQPTQPTQPAQPVQPTEDLSNKEVESKTVKTYGDGSQEEVVKKQIPAQQMAPVAPAEPVQQQAVQAPVAPQEVPQVQAQQPQEQETVTPVNPVQTQLPQPGPGVQVASTQPGAGVAEAARATQAQQATAPTVQAPPAPQPAGPSQEELHQQQIIAARNETDPQKRRQLYASILTGDVSEGTKALANRFIAEDYLKGRKMAEAEEKIAKATPNDLARYMADRKEDGSYLKAILFQRLGLTELAKQEQEKISPNLKFESAVDETGKRYTVERNNRGEITRAFTPEGRTASQEDIARLSANASVMKGANIGSQLYRDPVTNLSLTKVDTANGPIYYDKAGNRTIPKGEPIPLTAGSDVQTQFQVAQARQSGTQAAQTGAPQMMTPEVQAQVQRLDGDIAGLQREIKQPKIAGESDQAYQQRQLTLNQELAQRQQQRGQLVGTGGVTTTGGVSGAGQRPGENYLQYQERLKREGEVSTTAAKADIELQKEERSNFLTYEEKEIIPKADAAGSIASTRKSQLKGPDGILANPEIVGMMSGQGGVASEVGNIVRDLITGARTDDELSQRVNALGLTQRQKDVLYNQIQLNRQIAPKTLKENAGAGSVSDAEQKANRDAAINIAKVPLYTAVTMLSKDQFDKDQTVARQAFRNSNPQLTTVRSFNEAWTKEKSRLDKEYNQIYEERAKYISKYYQDGKNPGAIVDAYKYYPVPEFNRQTNQWDYGTDYSRKAARPKLNSFEK